MDERSTNTDGRIDRRQFLEMAGMVSMGALLAACGAPAAQAPAAQTSAHQEMAAANQPIPDKRTTLGRYLLIARYNRQKWNNLSVSEQHKAHETAEELFPEAPQQKNLPLAGEGVLALQTFHSDLFGLLHDKIAGNTTPGKAPSDIANELFANWQPPAADIKDPGIGWLAILDAKQLDEFVKSMGGREGPLWRMYDIEIIPLNNDRSTQDIYDFMTPVSWKK